jgi:toxin-antitoxin system PIN domain toxin
MIAVDTNILVYAHRQDSAFHEAASDVVRALAEGSAAWAIPWPCVHEFYAIVTHPRIYRPASTSAQAIDQLEVWFAAPGLVLLAEADDYWKVLRELLASARIAGPATHDARIAALCSDHGVTELWSCDRDFSRFSALRLRNPLVAR